MFTFLLNNNIKKHIGKTLTIKTKKVKRPIISSIYVIFNRKHIAFWFLKTRIKKYHKNPETVQKYRLFFIDLKHYVFNYKI